MKLETENGTTVHSPNALAVEQTLKGLNRSGNSFAILSHDPQTYVQAMMVDDGLMLEYQEGDIDEHYQATRPLTRDEAISVFQRYAAGDTSWEQEVPWEHFDVTATKRSGCGVTVLCIAAACVAIYAVC